MADLDSLQIKVNASATDASKSLEKLAASMKSLRDNLNVDTQKLQGIATSIRNLSDAASGFKGGKSTELTSLSRALKSFNGIDTNSIYGITAALKNLTNGISGAKNIDVSGITGVAASLAKLGGKNATTGVSNLLSMKDQLAQFITGMNSVGSLNFDVSGLSNLISGLSRMGGKASTQATKNLPTISAQLQNFVRQMNQIGSLSFDMTNLSQMVVAIGKLGSVASGRALTNIPKLAVALKELLQTLSTAPQVSSNLIQMTNALASLAKTGSSAGRAADSMTKQFNLFGSTASSVKTKSISLAAAIGKVYASYWMLFRAFGKLGEAIDISSSLTEVENVVRTVFGNYESMVNDFASNSIQKFGMSELSVKQFASRFQAMGTAMGFSQGKMANMSVELTKLTADMASFYDVSQKDVAQDLESIFTGQTRPLRTYGLDLTQATLKEWALNQGIEANFKTMTQAQKAMLRYQYVMANTAAAQGDFARTADTWHNQVTILKQSFQQLAGIVGGSLINAFKPLVKTLNAVLQKVISFAEMVTNALGAIFGWKYEASAAGIADDWSDAADSADDVAGSTGDAADNVNKLKKNVNAAIRAFDELKTISLPKDSSKKSSDSGSGSGSGSGAGSGGLVATDTIFKDFESNIKNLEQLGKSISGALIDAMRGIDWDSIYAAADGFGTGLAQFLNGLFAGQKGTTLFGEMGRTIAGALNTVLHGLDSFGETFDWKQFGNSIADGVNKFFQTFDFALLAQTLNVWVQGLYTTITTALGGISWEDVYNGIKSFLENLDIETVAIIIGAVTIKKIGKAIFGAGVLSKLGSLIKGGIVSAIVSALGAEEGTSIGAALFGAIKRGISGFVTKIGLVIEGLFSGMNFSEALASAFGGSASTISSVASAIGGVVSVVTGAFTAIYNFVQMLKNGFNWLNEALMVVGVAITTIGVIILAPIEGVGIAIAALVGAIVAAVATVTVLVKEHWEEIKGVFSKVGEWFNTNVITPVVGFFKGLWTKVSGFFKKLWKDISGVWSTVSGWFNDTVIEPVVSFFKGLYTRVHQVFQGLWIIVQAVWKVASEWFSKNVTTPIKEKFEWLRDKVSGALKTAWTWIHDKWVGAKKWFTDTVVTPIKTLFTDLKTQISKPVKEAWGKIVDKWEGAKKWFTEHVTDPVKGAFSDMGKGIKKVFTGVWKAIVKGVVGAMNSVISGIESAINFIVGGINKIIGGFNKIVSWAAKVAEVDWGGVDLVPKVSLSRISIKGYETGGFPDKYSMFMAGENGVPEMLGTVGGKTAVAGGAEITGIKDAIIAASEQENALLKQQNQLLQGILQKQFGITTNEIGRAAREYGRDYYNRTGDNAYVF